jgi:thymidylate synthase (FAD)
MSGRKVTILMDEPTIEVIAHMQLATAGLERMARWVKEHRPECLPDDYNNWTDLFPHNEMDNDHSPRSSNELLVELAGRKCYDSFGLKAGKKSNKEYIANTQAGDVPHSSILYHAKMSFFFAGISRRVSHEIIRNYVGSDRDEEGSPSQESTRFTHHYGFFICPPRYLVTGTPFASIRRDHFEDSMQDAYNRYLEAVEEEVANYQTAFGRAPTGIEKKRIYEAASSFLPHQSETSFIWTTNPMAIAKFCRERDNEHADLEIQRFARKWKKLCVVCWPNLFPQLWMHE